MNYFVAIPATHWKEATSLLLTKEQDSAITDTDRREVRVFFEKEEDARTFTQMMFKEFGPLLPIVTVKGPEDVC